MQPGSEPGQETEPQPEAGLDTSETLEQPTETTEGEHQPEAGSETTEGTERGETAPGEQVEEGTEAQAGLNKRIGKLLARITELETKLEERAPAPAQPQAETGPSPLDQVTDLNELDRRADQAEGALEEVEMLLAKLPVAPGRVEHWLREQGVILKDERGEEDFSPERMADMLGNARAKFRGVSKAVPKRRAWLQEYAAAHAQVVKALPWVGDKTDQRYAMMQQILTNFPGLKTQPNYEYWLACAIRGHQATQADLSKTRTQPQRPQPTAPRTAATSAAPRVNGDRLGAAKSRVLKEGSKAALAEFFEVTGFAGQ